MQDWWDECEHNCGAKLVKIWDEKIDWVPAGVGQADFSVSFVVVFSSGNAGDRACILLRTHICFSFT